MEIKIIATTGRAQGQSVMIRAAKFFIGRHDNCQLRPDIPDLAGIHALIEQRDERLYLRDFGAEGGTGINDRVLHARETEVFHGDLIQIGPLVLTLSVRLKGEETHTGLVNAPIGWPFLEGVEIKPLPSFAHAEVPAREPVLAGSHGFAPAEVSAFVLPMGSSRLEAAMATATVEPPSEAARPSMPLLPIAPRPVLSKSPLRKALSCEVVDDVMVVTILSADLNEEETVSPVRYELRTILDKETVPDRTVIDMGNTRYLSSRAVGVLLAHYQGLERKGASMRVCRVSKEIKPVLDQMRLSMLIDIYPTVEEAVQTPWE